MPTSSDHIDASESRHSATALRPVLVLALDGATFDVIEPMVAAGELPNLAAWIEEGQAAPLPSTTPPVTFPAWSAFMTGLEPADHGIFDFTQKHASDYRLKFVNSTDRRAASIFKRTSEAGGRVLVLGMPATHPPEPVNGLLVCGFDAPVSTGTDERSASDPQLYRAIADKVGPWMRPELNESAQADDFHERAVSTLLTRVDRKRDFALEAMEQMKARNGAMPALTMISSPKVTPRGITTFAITFAHLLETTLKPARRAKTHFQRYTADSTTLAAHSAPPRVRGSHAS